MGYLPNIDNPNSPTAEAQALLAGNSPSGTSVEAGLAGQLHVYDGKAANQGGTIGAIEAPETISNDGLPLLPSRALADGGARIRVSPARPRLARRTAARGGKSLIATIAVVALVALALVVGVVVFKAVFRPADPAQLPAAAAVQEAPEEPWQKDLIEEWKTQLESLEAAKEQARFAREHGVQFRFLDDPGGEKRPNAWAAAYIDKKVYVNRTMFKTYLDQLEKEGVPEKDRIRALAGKYSNFVGHEIGHGVTQEEVKAATGLDFALPSVEEEYLSIMREVRIFREIREKTGLTTKRGETLLLFWRLGPKHVLEFTQRTYGGKISSVLADSNEKLISNTQEDVKLVKDLIKIREFRQKFGNVEQLQEIKDLPEADRRKVLAKVAETRGLYDLLEKKLREGMLPVEFRDEDLDGILSGLEQTLLLLRNPQKFKTLREYYLSKMAAIREEWERPEWQAWRKRQAEK